MTFRQTIKLLKIRVTARQRRACVYLERRGYLFCAHFGYANAAEMARKVRANGGHLREFQDVTIGWSPSVKALYARPR